MDNRVPVGNLISAQATKSRPIKHVTEENEPFRNLVMWKPSVGMREKGLRCNTHEKKALKSSTRSSILYLIAFG